MKHLITLLALSLMSAPAFAGDYGDAGCGLGSLVWGGNKGKLAQICAATTNATSYTQTFGITTGTSKCTSSGLVQAEREQEYFANVNRDALYQEMAAGRGDTVSGLAALMGCANISVFGTFAKSHYTEIFPSAETSGAEMLKNLRTHMGKDSTLQASCANVTASR
jgi:hypothetical protein